jgi:sodium transport system permease protein
LRNFLERQTYVVKEAPADFEARLRRSTFSDPVVVVPADFEAALVRGDVPIVEIVSDSANQRSEASTARIERLLGGFSRERALLSLALRGVSAQLLEPMPDRGPRPGQHADAGDAHHGHAALLRDDGGALRRAQRRARHHRRRARARLARAAAHEPDRALGAGRRQVGRGRVRQRPDRHPQLLQLPARPVGLRSDTLAAMFQYGPREAALFIVILLPLAPRSPRC